MEDLATAEISRSQLWQRLHFGAKLDDGRAITLGLLVLGLSLKLEVVDGALAASRFFGKSLDNPMMSADVALGAVFSVASQFIFYGGMLFGIFSCSDFAPKLLSPGRIEHLLALPVRRWELLAGTFLGVLILALAGAAYGSSGCSGPCSTRSRSAAGASGRN